jgi:alkanesulfonate monooxygenase SsuD/methylene tetrahydromethanopterin reductase-like flavin-dependent oxidoreductase (luciferase family)
VREAAQEAGRNPDDVEITARLFISVDPPGPAVNTGIRRHINAYLNVPVYKAFHEWLGRSAALGPMWDAWASGDRKAAVAAVPQEVMNDLIVQGSPDEMKAQVQRYFDAGVDTAFLQMQSFEADPAKKRENILNAVRNLAPQS